jgi:hypothetical protein
MIHAQFFRHVAQNRFATAPCASLGLDPAVVLAAYEEVHAIFDRLLPTSPAAYAAAAGADVIGDLVSTWPVKSWLRPQQSKAQLQIPLVHLHEGAKSIRLPPNLARVAAVFDNTVTAYVTSQLVADGDAAAAAAFRASLLKKSVLRLWSYDINNGGSSSDETIESARAHVDPGFATILLSGSTADHVLQAHTTFDGCAAATSNYGSDEHKEADPAGWVNVGYGSGGGNESAFDPTTVVLMTGTMLQVATGCALKHAFHRVIVQPQKDPAVGAASYGAQRRRIQIVLELRPDDPKAYYARIAQHGAADAEKRKEEDAY